jgi:hypothetical protein
MAKTKRTPTNWNRYCSEKRVEVKSKNSDLTGPELTKLLGENWSKLSEREKAKYNTADK